MGESLARESTSGGASQSQGIDPTNPYDYKGTSNGITNWRANVANDQVTLIDGTTISAAENLRRIQSFGGSLYASNDLSDSLVMSDAGGSAVGGMPSEITLYANGPEISPAQAEALRRGYGPLTDQAAQARLYDDSFTGGLINDWSSNATEFAIASSVSKPTGSELVFGKLGEAVLGLPDMFLDGLTSFGKMIDGTFTGAFEATMNGIASVTGMRGTPYPNAAGFGAGYMAGTREIGAEQTTALYAGANPLGGGEVFPVGTFEPGRMVDPQVAALPGFQYGRDAAGVTAIGVGVAAGIGLGALESRVALGLGSLSNSALGALRYIGLSDTEIASHIAVNGDVYLFRGTSPGWTGNPGSQATAVSASVDPYSATVFALEARTQGGSGVIQYGTRSQIGTFSEGNWQRLAIQEREVALSMDATQFAQRAPNSIPVDTARRVLQDMGFPPLPYSVQTSTQRGNLLSGVPRMTPGQVADFLYRIK